MRNIWILKVSFTSKSNVLLSTERYFTSLTKAKKASQNLGFKVDIKKGITPNFFTGIGWKQIDSETGHAVEMQSINIWREILE